MEQTRIKVAVLAHEQWMATRLVARYIATSGCMLQSLGVTSRRRMTLSILVYCCAQNELRTSIYTGNLEELSWSGAAGVGFCSPAAFCY